MKCKIKLFLLFIILIPLKVLASELEIINLDDYYVYNNGNISKLKMFKIIETNEFVFSIEPYSDLSSKEVTTKDFSCNLFPEITVDKLNDIQDILYLGYGYEDQFDIKWYILSQFMLWDTLDYNIEIKNNDGDNILDLYKYEYDIYCEKVKNYKKYPSFFDHNIDIDFGNKEFISDTNNISSEYQFIIPYHIKYSKHDSGITLLGSIPKQDKISAHRIDIGSGINKVYNNGNLNFITNNAASKRIYETIVNVHGTKIKIVNVDEEDKPIENHQYNLYNSQGRLITTLVTNFKGEGITVYLPKDNYYLTEKKINNKFIPINEKIHFGINNFGITEVLIKHKRIKPKLIITMKYHFGNKNELYPDTGIKFQIYKNNLLIAEQITDEKGNAVFELLLGDYILKQVNSRTDLPLIEEKISITDFNNIMIDKINLVKNIIDTEDYITVEDNLITDLDDKKAVSKEHDNLISNDSNILNKDVENIVNKKIVVDVPSTNKNITVYIIIIVSLNIIVALFLYGIKKSS